MITSEESLSLWFKEIGNSCWQETIVANHCFSVPKTLIIHTVIIHTIACIVVDMFCGIDMYGTT